MRSKLISEFKDHTLGFITQEPKNKCDAVIRIINQPNIERVKRKADNYYFIHHYIKKSEVSYITFYQTSNWQLNALLEDILHVLLTKNNGFEIHASSILINDKVYLFLGKSGAGKSTISTFLSSRYKLLSDDMVIVRKYNSKYFVFQTPFFERNTSIMKSSGRYPIEKVFFIEKNIDVHSTEIMNSKKVFSLLLKHVQVGNSHGATSSLSYLREFSNIKGIFFSLQFPKNERKVLRFFRDSFNQDESKI